MFDVIAEFIGTFVFLSCILAVGQPVPIAVTLLAMIYFAGHLSGGHFNPAVSTAVLARGGMDGPRFASYVAAQLLGALAAVAFYRAASGRKQ